MNVIPKKEFEKVDDYFNHLLGRADVIVPLLGRTKLRGSRKKTIKTTMNMMRADEPERIDYIKNIDWDEGDETARSSLGYICFDEDEGEAFIVHRLTKDYYKEWQKKKEEKREKQKKKTDGDWK